MAGSTPAPDEFGHGNYFEVKLDGDPVANEACFHEVTGLNVFVDQTVYQEGGKNDGPHILPGSAKYENLCFKRGISASTKFFEWVMKYVTTPKTEYRMSGSVTLMRTNNSPVMTWRFEKGWPTRYEGPHLDSLHQNFVLETVEIAHGGLKLQPGGGAPAAAAGGGAGQAAPAAG
jgi:phage tail-like protein